MCGLLFSWFSRLYVENHCRYMNCRQVPTYIHSNTSKMQFLLIRSDLFIFLVWIPENSIRESILMKRWCANLQTIITSLLLQTDISLCLFSRAGSGHFFSGSGRVWPGFFWPGLGSGWRFLATGQFGPLILAYFCRFLTNFSAKSAIFEVRAGTMPWNILGTPQKFKFRIRKMKILAS